MVLVIGGYASGKRDYVQNALGFLEADISDGLLDARPVLNALQDLVQHCLSQGGEPQSLLPWLLEKQVVVCDEMGSVVVPIDERQDCLREEVGRLCIRLAEQAERVVRVVCGIPQVIK